MAALHTLANGVRVIADPIPGFETLALSVVIGRGARWENADQSGWSHLLEHMVFKGAGQRSARDIVEAIEAEGGHINAATGHERTSFQVRALKGGLPLAMDVLTDLVRRPVLDADELEREKGVVAQEIAEAADTPDDLVYEMAQAAAFGDTALGRPILGTVESIGGATRALLGDFSRDLYAADRIVISAAGAIDEDELLQAAERCFGDAPARKDAARPEAAVFAGEAQVREAKLEQAHLVLLLPAPGARDPDYFALRLFAEILGGGMSSRLFQEVRENRGLAYNIDAYSETYSDTGLLGIYAGCAAKDAVMTARLCGEEVVRMVADVAEGELSRAKAQMKGSLFMARESALARAEQSAGQCLLFDRLLPSAELGELIDAVQIADLKRLGARLLEPAASARSVLGPKSAGAAADAFHKALFP